MDLVADMLLAQLRAEYKSEITAVRICPEFVNRFTRVPGLGAKRFAYNADRLLNRLWDYPGLFANGGQQYDLFHIVDHSYAHLAHRLPPKHLIITCHDLDTFRCVLEPKQEPRSFLFRKMTEYILAGFQRAARVVCNSAATKTELLAYNLVPPERVVVIHNGVHPTCRPDPDPKADSAASSLFGEEPGERLEILHVGSTIARKRIDVLLRTFAAVRKEFPEARLIQVGGSFDQSQIDLIAELDLSDSIILTPFLERSILAAVYRRSALVLLTSEREGFGLPLIEAMACGTPAIASDLISLREVGADAAEYCPAGDVPTWTKSTLRLLTEKTQSPEQWRFRRARCITQGASFSWKENARNLVNLYREVAG
jgi:glycosyltransferase involved in cell wall biosynthesis